MGGALAEGIQTSVVLIDDGVFVARDGQNMGGTAWTPLAPAMLKSMTQGARVLVHTPSAQSRGLLQDEHFAVGVEAIDDEGLARVLAASGAVVFGGGLPGVQPLADRVVFGSVLPAA